MKKLTTALIILLCTAAVLGSLLSCVYTATLAARIDQVSRSSRADMNYLRGMIRALEGELTDSILDRLDAIARPSDEASRGDSPETSESANEMVGLPVGGDAERDTAADTCPETISEMLTPDTEEPRETPEAPETIVPSETLAPVPTDTAAEESDCTDAVAEPETYPENPPETRPEVEVESASETTPPESESESEPANELENEPETDTLDLPTHNRPETETPVPPVVLYTIAAYNGHIGVFDATGRIVREVNVFLFALPLSDREALTVGIPAYSREEMVAIVARYE